VVTAVKAVVPGIFQALFFLFAIAGKILLMIPPLKTYTKNYIILKWLNKKFHFFVDFCLNIK